MSDHITFSEAAEVMKDIQALSKLPTDEAATAAREIADRLNNVTLDIAVTGRTGAGKSMFVNAIRGVREGESGAAETGVTETTMEPSMYPHPRMPNVRLWDLPGIGGIKFETKTYFKKIKFDRYDFFIIVSSERFGENDLKLAQEIQKRKKLFYFVRSKIDNDVRAEGRKPKFNLEELLAKIREDCRKT
ncbi:hypothetical protein AAFF_G00046930 [Aldrovandia affinis]|uniref:IRG-type G domain-containing protein n=1 Tax=Aldrovandia affinis TaxID=143900 RepID=A0AAD7VX79_9TELE|nr:hypothetical protein AAFF_G00046930 [Aldrovandia affinis]